uniref:Uncharacterized protein n=1 Tax=viral metagenome TaxID=1070528 RepID=A0A6C0I3M2_9ZZZZ
MSSFLFETFIKEPTTSSFMEMLPLIQPFMLTVENKSLFSTVEMEKKIVLENKVEAVVVVENKVEAIVVENKVEAVVVVENKVESVVVVENKLKPIINTILPKNRNDSLFWCLYILHFGYNDYIQVSRNYGVRSLEVKKQVGDWLTKFPNALKLTNYKVTKASIQEIISECITCQKETSMLSLLAILAHFKMNLFIIDAKERFLLEFIGGCHDGPTYLIQKGGRSNYSIVGDRLTDNDKKYWKEKCLCLHHYEKPLQTISHYKVDDLHSIINKLNIKLEEGKKYKKQDLYLLLWNECLQN